MWLQVRDAPGFSPRTVLCSPSWYGAYMLRVISVLCILGSVLVNLQWLSCCPSVWTHSCLMAPGCLLWSPEQDNHHHLLLAWDLAGEVCTSFVPCCSGTGGGSAALLCLFPNLYIICCPLLLSTVNVVWYSVSWLTLYTAFGDWTSCHVQYLQWPFSKTTPTSIWRLAHLHSCRLWHPCQGRPLPCRALLPLLGSWGGYHDSGLLDIFRVWMWDCFPLCSAADNLFPYLFRNGSELILFWKLLCCTVILYQGVGEVLEHRLKAQGQRARDLLTAAAGRGVAQRRCGGCGAQEGRPCTWGEGDMSGCLRSGALQFLGSPSAVLPEPYPQHLTDKQAVSWRLSFYLRNVCRWCIWNNRSADILKYCYVKPAPRITGLNWCFSRREARLYWFCYGCPGTELALSQFQYQNPTPQDSLVLDGLTLYKMQSEEHTI